MSLCELPVRGAWRNFPESTGLLDLILNHRTSCSLKKWWLWKACTASGRRSSSWSPAFPWPWMISHWSADVSADLQLSLKNFWNCRLPPEDLVEEHQQPEQKLPSTSSHSSWGHLRGHVEKHLVASIMSGDARPERRRLGVTPKKTKGALAVGLMRRVSISAPPEVAYTLAHGHTHKDLVEVVHHKLVP